MRWLALLFIATSAWAAPYGFIQDRNVFSGEAALNLTINEPLSVSSTGKVTTGIISADAYNDGNFTCTTTDQVITGVSIAAASIPSGAYEVAMSADINSATAGIVVTIHFQSNGATTTHGTQKGMPFTGGTLTTGNQRMPFSKTIHTTLNGTNTLEMWCSTSSGTVTVANSALTARRN